MSELLVSQYVIAMLFFGVALAYSSVGLGGGSAYTALLAIAGYGAMTIPMVSLVLNLIATSIGSYNFIRYRHVRIGLIVPFLLSSLPMAYLGGMLQLPPVIFYWLLLGSLLFIATRIYLWKATAFHLTPRRGARYAVAVAACALIGFIAGSVGIGGGIFLVPVIIILGLGTEKEAAASGAIFIWLNSLSGLAARLQYNAIDLADHLPLMVAVLLGAALGSFLGASRLSRNTMEKILGVILIVAMIFLVRKLLTFYLAP